MSDFQKLFYDINRHTLAYETATTPADKTIHSKHLVQTTQTLLNSLESINSRKLVAHLNAVEQENVLQQGQNWAFKAFSPPASYDEKDNTLANKLQLLEQWRHHQNIPLPAPRSANQESITPEAPTLFSRYKPQKYNEIRLNTCLTALHNHAPHLLAAVKSGAEPRSLALKEEMKAALKNYQAAYNETLPAVFKKTLTAQQNFLNPDKQTSHHTHWGDMTKADSPTLLQIARRIPRQIQIFLDTTPLRVSTWVRQIRNIFDPNRQKAEHFQTEIYEESATAHQRMARAARVLQQLSKEAEIFGGASLWKQALDELSQEEGFCRHDFPSIKHMPEAQAAIEVNLRQEEQHYIEASLASLRDLEQQQSQQIEETQQQLAAFNTEIELRALQAVLHQQYGDALDVHSLDYSKINSTQWQIDMQLWQQQHQAEHQAELNSLREQLHFQQEALTQTKLDIQEAHYAAEEGWLDIKQQRRQALTTEKEHLIGQLLREKMFHDIDLLYQDGGSHRPEQIAHTLLDHLHMPHLEGILETMIEHCPAPVQNKVTREYLQGCNTPSAQQFTLFFAEDFMLDSLKLQNAINPIISTDPLDVRDTMLGGYDESLSQLSVIAGKWQTTIQNMMKPDDRRFMGLHLKHGIREALEKAHEITGISLGSKRRHATEVNEILMNSILPAMDRLLVLTEHDKIYNSFSPTLLQDIKLQMDTVITGFKAIAPVLPDCAGYYLDKNVAKRLADINVFTRRLAYDDKETKTLENWTYGDAINGYMREFIADLRQKMVYDELMVTYFSRRGAKIDSMTEDTPEERAQKLEARHQAEQENKFMVACAREIKMTMEESVRVLPTIAATYRDELRPNKMKEFRSLPWHQSIPRLHGVNQSQNMTASFGFGYEQEGIPGSNVFTLDNRYLAPLVATNDSSLPLQSHTQTKRAEGFGAIARDALEYPLEQLAHAFTAHSR